VKKLPAWISKNLFVKMGLQAWEINTKRSYALFSGFTDEGIIQEIATGGKMGGEEGWGGGGGGGGGDKKQQRGGGGGGNKKKNRVIYLLGHLTAIQDRNTALPGLGESCYRSWTRRFIQSRQNGGPSPPPPPPPPQPPRCLRKRKNKKIRGSGRKKPPREVLGVSFFRPFRGRMVPRPTQMTDEANIKEARHRIAQGGAGRIAEPDQSPVVS